MKQAAGLFISCGCEYVHCIGHLPYKPRSPALAYMKARHLEHHFHDENGKYGITNFDWDRLFGTFYVRGERPAKSHLGYIREEARLYPWVADRSGGDAPDRPVRKR